MLNVLILNNYYKNRIMFVYKIFINMKSPLTTGLLQANTNK